jgi:hypothetical protein
MSSENDENHTTEVTEATEIPTDHNSTDRKIPKVRSEAQKHALDVARARAVASRIETASLKRKEREIEWALAAKTATERAKKINSEYDALTATNQPEEKIDQPEEKPKKRKPARRVIVTEVQLDYQRSASKMFAYD